MTKPMKLKLGIEICEARIEEVGPKAMLARIMAELEHEARRRKGAEGKSGRKLAEEAKCHAAKLLAKLDTLNGADARDIAATVVALITAAFIVRNKRRRQRMQPIMAHARKEREVELRERMEQGVTKYLGARAAIKAVGEKATDERVWTDLANPESPYFLWEGISLNTVKSIKKRARRDAQFNK
jgi:hypothetical protein